MTISLMPTRADILGEKPIPRGALAYLQGELRHEVHELLLTEFIRKERTGKLTRSKLAERIHKAKAQVTRWLSVPANLTLDTLSDLLVGMGKRLEIRVVDFDDLGQSVGTARQMAPVHDDAPQSPTQFDFPDADVSPMKIESSPPSYRDSNRGELTYSLH